MKRAELVECINSALDESLAGCETDNPLEAWTRFVDRLDAKGRRRIGDVLERQGRNRYTGEVIKNGKRNAERESLLEQEDPKQTESG